MSSSGSVMCTRGALSSFTTRSFASRRICSAVIWIGAGARVLAARVDAEGKDVLRQLGDRLRDRIGSGGVVLGAVIDGKPSLLAMVTPDVVARGVKAGDIVRETAAMVDGRGGGRADIAEAGGKDPEKLDEALAAVAALVGRGLVA